MAENEQINSAAPPLSDGNTEDIRRLDALIVESRERALESKASVAELKWMLRINCFLILPLVICYVTVPIESRRAVATYIAIIGFVIAGWGLFRSFQARRQKLIAALYLFAFLMSFVIYTTALLTLTRVFEPYKLNSPMRKK